MHINRQSCAGRGGTRIAAGPGLRGLIDYVSIAAAVSHDQSPSANSTLCRQPDPAGCFDQFSTVCDYM